MTINRAIAGVSALIILMLAYSWWSSNEHAIRRRLDGLAAAVSVPANDTDLGRVTRLASVRDYLTEDIRIDNGAQRLESRDALLAAIGLWRPPAGGVNVEFVDAQVTLGSDRVRAQVYLTTTITSRDAQGGPAVDAREATVTMIKREGEWVVANVATMETLQRPRTP